MNLSSLLTKRKRISDLLFLNCRTHLWIENRPKFRLLNFSGSLLFWNVKAIPLFQSNWNCLGTNIFQSLLSPTLHHHWLWLHFEIVNTFKAKNLVAFSSEENANKVFLSALIVNCKKSLLRVSVRCTSCSLKLKSGVGGPHLKTSSHIWKPLPLAQSWNILHKCIFSNSR